MRKVASAFVGLVLFPSAAAVAQSANGNSGASHPNDPPKPNQSETQTNSESSGSKAVKDFGKKVITGDNPDGAAARE